MQNINIRSAGTKLPTDDEIISIYRDAPTPETVKYLCAICHSESRPIRALCEAGLMGHRAVPADKLPKVNGDFPPLPPPSRPITHSSNEKYTTALKNAVLAYDAEGADHKAIARRLNLPRSEVNYILKKYGKK